MTNKIKGSVLLFLLPTFLLGIYLSYNITITIQNNIEFRAKDTRSKLQKNDLLVSELNNLNEIKPKDTDPFKCQKIDKVFKASENSYSREVCYLSDINKKVPLLDLKSLGLDILPSKKCLSKIEQVGNNYTIQGSTIKAKQLVASETCNELASETSSLSMNISLDKLLISTLGNKSVLMSTGYIEIGELIFDLPEKEILIIAGGDVFIGGVRGEAKNLKAISINGETTINNKLQEVKKNMERRVVYPEFVERILGVITNH